MMSIAANEVAYEPSWQQHCYGIDNLITDQSLIAREEAGHAHGVQLAKVALANSRYGLSVRAWCKHDGKSQREGAPRIPGPDDEVAVILRSSRGRCAAPAQ